MPVYTVAAPNGKTYRMQGPAGLTEQDLYAHILNRDPTAGTPPPPPKTGMGAAFQSGLENMISSGKAGIAGLFGDTQAAAAEALQAQQEQGQKYDAQIGLDRLGKVYDEKGLLAAGSELVGQAGRAIAQSAPEMGAAMGGARLGAMAGSVFGPVGTVVGGIGGGILGGIMPMTGRNLAKQQEVTPGQVSYGAAIGAGGAQAALETVAPLALMGGRVAAKVLGKDAAAIAARLGPEAAENVAERGLMRTIGRGAGVGAAGEATTEVAQEALERLQAGQNLLDEDALKAYGEAAYGGAIAGAPLSAAGHAWDRSGAIQTVEGKRQAAEALAAQKVAEEQALKAQQDAEQDAIRKADPDYAADVGKRYAQYEAQKADMLARAKALTRDGTDAGKVEGKALYAAAIELRKNSQPLIDEYIATKNAQAALQPPDEYHGPAPEMVGPEPGSPEAKRAARVEELQSLISTHEETDADAHERLLEVGRTGTSAELAEAKKQWDQRKQAHARAQKELAKIAPEIQEQKDAAAAAALKAQADEEAYWEERANFDPVKAQARIAEITALRQNVKDESEIGKLASQVAEQERLQALLDESAGVRESQARDDAVDTAGKLAGAAARGEVTQQWPGLDVDEHELPGTPYVDTPEVMAADTDKVLNKVFATQERSSMLDALAKSGDEDANLISAMRKPLRGEGGAIVEQLASMPRDERKKTAKALQAHSKQVVKALHHELAQARKTGDTPRFDSLNEARKVIGKMQADTKGRAHYMADFYNITEPLIRGVVRDARGIVGLNEATGPRAAAGRQYQVLKDLEARYAGIADPRITAAMNLAAEEGTAIDYDPRMKPGRQGKAPTRKSSAPLVDKEGQGMLFQPEEGPAPTADTPRQLLRQRVDKLLAVDTLSGQARSRLQRAADILGDAHPRGAPTGPHPLTDEKRAKQLVAEQGKHPLVPQRVLEEITRTVEQAEKGVGMRLGAGADEKVVSDKGRLRLMSRNKPAQRSTLQKLEMDEVGDNTPDADARQGEFKNWLDVGFTGERDAEGQPIHRAKPGAKADETYVGRQSAGLFQRLLDAGVRPAAKKAEKAALTSSMLKWKAAKLRERIKAADDAKERLKQVDAQIASYTPEQRSNLAALQAQPLLNATKAATKAQEAVDRHLELARAAEAGGEGAGYPHLEAATKAANKVQVHTDKVNRYREVQKAIYDADTAPAQKVIADQRAALVAELKQVVTELAAAKKAQAATAETAQAKRAVLDREREKATKKAAALPQELVGDRAYLAPSAQAINDLQSQINETRRALRVVPGESRQVQRQQQEQLDEALKPLLLEMRALTTARRDLLKKVGKPVEEVQAPVPTEAERRAAAAGTTAKEYTERTGALVERFVAYNQSEGIDLSSDAVADAIKRAKSFPGVTNEDVQDIFDKVRNYKQTARAFASEGAKVRNDLSALADEMKAFRDDNPGGVILPKQRKEYAKALVLKAKLAKDFKDVTRADQRAEIIAAQDANEKNLAFYDRQRTPLADNPEYREMMKDGALLEFKIDMIEQQKAAVADRLAREGEGGAGARQRVFGNVRHGAIEYPGPSRQPPSIGGTAVGPGGPVTRMEATAASRKQKTGFQNKTATPTADTQAANETIAGNRRNEDAGIAYRKLTEAKWTELLKTMSPLEAWQATWARVAAAPKAKPAAQGKRMTEAQRLAAEAQEAAAEQAVAEAQTAAAEQAKRDRKALAQREKTLAAQREQIAKDAAAALEKAPARLPVTAADRKALVAQHKQAKATEEAAKRRTPAAEPKVLSDEAADTAAKMAKVWAKQEEAARQKIRDTIMAGKVPKIVSDAYEASDHTLLSEWQMERARDGQLDKVLGAIETDGSTQALRDLAKKVQAFVKNTRIVVGENVGIDGAAASYDAATDTIKIHPLMLGEETLLHEVVHAATLRALTVPDSQLTREQINARNELQSLLKRLQADPAFKREYGAENIAELASEVMTNQGLRDKINAQKPGFIRRFIDAVRQMLGIPRRSSAAQAQAQIEALFQPSRPFSKEEVAAMREMLGSTKVASAARAATPSAIPALDQFSRSVSAAPRAKGIEGAKAFIKDANAGMAAEYAGVDMRVPLVTALSKGDPTQYMQGHYYIRMNDQRMSMVGTALTEGTLGLKKDKTGKYTIEATGDTSGKDVIAAIDALPGATPEAKYALAQSYLVAQRAANKGWDTLGWETSAETQALGEAALAEVNANPALKAKLDEVRKVYNDYNKGLIQFAVEAGAIPKAEGARLLKDGDYVPFYRVRANGVAELAMGENTHIRIGDIRRQPYLQELKGDEGKLLPLSEAIMRNTMLLTDLGLRNLTTKSVAYSMQDMGKEKGAPDKRTGKPTNLNAIHKSSDRPPPAGPDIIKFKQEPDPNDPKDQANGGERWMRVTSAGTPFEGIPAEMLVQSLEGSHSVLTGMSKVAGEFGNLLRSGVTRTPAYILRQLIRDPWSASSTAGLSRGPVAAMLQSMREFVSMSRGTSKTGAELLRKGITQSGIFNGTADDLNKIALQLAGGNQPAYKKVFAALDRAAMRADAATRAQVYEDTLKKTGSEMEAALAAIEMMNFTKRGAHPAVQYATRMIPFMNAQIQALNVLAKAFRGTSTFEGKMQIKAKFMKNAMGLAAFSMLYAAGMEDDPDYAAASAHERYNNFFIPNPFGSALKIPIPYEVGFLFKVLPEMMMREMQGKFDDTDWEAFRGNLLGMVPGGTSLGMPQMIAPVVRSLANQDAFGNPIESAGQQHLAKSERSNDNTPEIAKALSGLMSSVLPESMVLSGPKIKALVDSYVGGMPLALLGMTDQFLPNSSKPERMSAQNPIWGSFIAKDVGTGPQASGYKALNSIEQVNATLAHLREEEPERAEAYAQEHAGAVNAKDAATNFKSVLKGLKEQEQDIRESTMSPPEKRQALNDLARLRNELHKEFVQNVRTLATSP